MIWKPLAGQGQEERALEQEYSRAEKQEKIYLGEKNLFIPRLLAVDYVPYNAVSWAYRRIEEARGTLCCGVTTYEIHHLVIEAGGKKTVVRFENRDACVACLDWIADKNPAAKIGYPSAKGGRPSAAEE